MKIKNINKHLEELTKKYDFSKNSVYQSHKKYIKNWEDVFNKAKYYVYVDGSINKNPGDFIGVSYIVFNQNNICVAKNQYSSAQINQLSQFQLTSYTSEAFALLQCLENLSRDLLYPAVIFSDCETIVKVYNQEYESKKHQNTSIFDDLVSYSSMNIKQEKTVRKQKKFYVLWIPGHSTIEGNNHAHNLAKNAMLEQKKYSGVE